MVDKETQRKENRKKFAPVVPFIDEVKKIFGEKVKVIKVDFVK